MYRFFDPVIRPVLDALAPQVVVEVGSDNGYGTQRLAEWCAAHGATLHSVDPLPKYDVEEWKARWGDVVRFHGDLSLNALLDIDDPDVVLIDGDHNWYTVFHELELLAKRAEAAARPFPLTFLHDVGWPYGRRDLYYDPATVAPAFLQPHRRGGLAPGERALQDEGFNDHLQNALHEGTPRNGVLTAVEDFVASTDGRVVLDVLPGLHGLAVLRDAAADEALRSALDEALGASGLRRVLEAVEKDRLDRLVAVSKLQRDVRAHRARAEAAKERADELRRAQDAELARARQELAAATEQVARLQGRLTEAERRQREAQERSLEDRRLLERREQELRSVQQQLSRLRGRRSVQVALRVAERAKPLVQLSRGDVPSRVRSSPAARRVAARLRAAGQPARPSERAAARHGAPARTRPVPPGSGPFGSVLEALLGTGLPPDVLSAWEQSETTGSAPLPERSAQPLVSVVMPTWNRAQLLQEAIGSVLHQSYDNWELLVCDDASDDDTPQVVTSFGDDRIRHLRLPRGGAARARNAGLAQAQGELIAYLDSDNLWHPEFLATMVAELSANPGRHLAYSKYFDVVVDGERLRLKKAEPLPFDYETLAERNFIDLNTVVHRRALFEQFGGFDERLVRQQDWDLVLKYAHLRAPLYVDRFLMLYRRCRDWGQITVVHRSDTTSPELVRANVAERHAEGLAGGRELPSLTVLSWDVCRNHFSKAYNVCEAMAETTQVQLLGFHFFDEPVFPPYSSAVPSFATTYLDGAPLPQWRSELARAVASVTGDVVYAVKPRLPSLGVALLRNYHFGTPLVLESNDLESVVTSPRSGRTSSSVRLADVDPADPRLTEPFGDLWTAVMEDLATRVPVRTTHNSVLDAHFGGGAFFVRNPKDERHYDPSLYARDEVRARLGFAPEDRVLLFGGMVRRHKGVFELLRLLERPGSPYRLLIVGSRETPDQRELRKRAGDRITIVDPVDRNEMAAINLACDSVILWLDPDVPASQYQMPFKLTDALAMRVPVIANDVGDLGDLGRRGVLRLVPFGDVDELERALSELTGDGPARLRMVDAGRRLYQREFSYAAVRAQMPLVLDAARRFEGPLPVAGEFAEFLSRVLEAQAARETGGRR